MCNRYTLHDREAALDAIAHALKHGLEPPDWTYNPRYNIGPGSIVPVIVDQAGGAAQLKPMVWGLIPFFERDKPVKRPILNATAEKARTSPAFRQAIAKRRCLLPANGYYEWQEVAGVKYPHLFTLSGGNSFAFAAIWEPASAEAPDTVALLTTRPNAVAAAVHNRMPVVLPPDQVARWLGSEPLAGGEFEALTAPLADEKLSERPVSRFVSNSRHEGPQCIAPPEPPAPEPQLSLF
ncbi:MAG TPA: SOS response-associated peptidase [Opitutaceae bacterium]|jgi:putative SOS response-associated peptidase YedK